MSTVWEVVGILLFGAERSRKAVVLIRPERETEAGSLGVWNIQVRNMHFDNKGIKAKM